MDLRASPTTRPKNEPDNIISSGLFFVLKIPEESQALRKQSEKTAATVSVVPTTWVFVTSLLLQVCYFPQLFHGKISLF